MTEPASPVSEPMFAKQSRTYSRQGDRRVRLRRAAFVAVVESADLRQRNDSPGVGWLDCARLGRVFLEGEVCARLVVVAEVTAKTTAQVALIKNNHVVEELAADGTDHALGKGILPRRARCGENLGDAHVLDPFSKLGAVDAVPIAEEEARR